MLADNLIEPEQAQRVVHWCADVLDTGAPGIAETWMAKVGVPKALMRTADRCVQGMGGTGVSDATIVKQLLGEMGACTLRHGPTEINKRSLARRIARYRKADAR